MPYTTEDYAPYVDASLTDDDIVHGEPVTVAWPSAGDRLNHCIVKFQNEAENFKEDTVAWPAKVDQTYTKGIGGTEYNVPTYTWDGSSAYVTTMNAYAVWTGPDDTNATLKWLVRPLETGTYSGEFCTDDSGQLQINRTLPSSLFMDPPGLVNTTYNVHTTFSVTLTAGEEYEIRIDATNTGERKGAAARLVAPSGVTFWTTRTPSYEAFVEMEQTKAVYDQMLAEDSGVPLETTVYMDGCTDYYHARAKAEEMVRTSRSAVSVSLKYVVREKMLEPGDLVKLESLTLALGDLFYLRVNEIRMLGDGTCELKGNKFEFEQLAWNVTETELGTKTNGGGPFTRAAGFFEQTERVGLGCQFSAAAGASVPASVGAGLEVSAAQQTEYPDQGGIGFEVDAVPGP